MMTMLCHIITIIHIGAVAADPTAAPGWPVGWGFAAHGGFPPLPAAFQGFSLERSTMGLFLGNASGMNSAEELSAEARFGFVGVGWQINNIPSNHSNLEQYELETARQLKALRPGVRVMLARESEATTTLYNLSRAKMLDPATQDWWVQCGSKPCNGSWYSPAGNTPKYFFNFSNRAAADWWVNEFIGGPLRSPEVDGIYFDSAPVAGPPDDGRGQGGGPGRADAQAAFDRALALIAAHGKWATAWNNDGQSLFPTGLKPDAPDYSLDSCSSLMRQWIRLGRSKEHTLQLQAGTDTPRDEMLAAFLISRGVSAVLLYPTLPPSLHADCLPHCMLIDRPGRLGGAPLPDRTQEPSLHASAHHGAVRACRCSSTQSTGRMAQRTRTASPTAWRPTLASR